MIHTMIAAITTSLPMPHILPGAITGLLIAASTFLWLKRDSRSGALMLLALVIGLGALAWGVLEGWCGGVGQRGLRGHHFGNVRQQPRA